MPIEGFCEPRFEPVRDAFRTNFRDRGEVGAAVTIMLGGQTVVDLVGGYSDAAAEARWRPDTLVDFYSVGKGVLSLLLLELVDAGAVELTTPVVEVWPEFAHGGKEWVTIADALSHRAAVPAVRETLTDEDLWSWDRMTGALAATEPWWAAGERHAYHTNTFGHLVGELVRRVSGEMPGTRLRRIADPLGADLHFGVPDADLSRCAPVIWAAPTGSPVAAPVPRDGLAGDALMNLLAHFNPPGYSSVGVVNTARWRQIQVPSTNGHGTATGLARLYSALTEPGRLVSPDLLSHATHTRSAGPCPILGEHVEFGLGFTPTGTRRPLGPNPHAFGHFGTGGALGFADPLAGVGFGYVMNHVIPRWQSSRNRALIDAFYGCLPDGGRVRR